MVSPAAQNNASFAFAASSNTHVLAFEPPLNPRTSRDLASLCAVRDTRPHSSPQPISTPSTPSLATSSFALIPISSMLHSPLPTLAKGSPNELPHLNRWHHITYIPAPFPPCYRPITNHMLIPDSKTPTTRHHNVTPQLLRVAKSIAPLGLLRERHDRPVCLCETTTVSS
jgi:hypothetical protein